jgi:hypothetical protein
MSDLDGAARATISLVTHSAAGGNRRTSLHASNQ